MKKKYIFLGVLALVIIIIATLIIVNLNNIMAIYDATRYTTEEIEKKMEEQEQKTQDVLSKYNQQNIKPLSEDEAKKLADGELTEENAIKIIMGKETEEQQETPLQSAPETKPEEKPIKEEAPKVEEEKTETENPEDVLDEKIGELIAKIYVLKAKYNNLISNENYNVASDFYSLPKEEQTKEKKYQMGLTFMNTLKGYQSQCDAEINVILTELTQLLKDNNMSTEIVDEIKNSYEEEKKNKIAYFVSKYTAKESRVVNEVK